ncbi:LysM peptidoglycan-binding domain-containing protein [Fictibacillus sp. Mic-4]|uniref:cell division suppressor protein YneA n=1 Tax=Fictibacillus TaxID=1329200 RepID=UPI000416C92F|nr:LysM peptidoglycan-binding domain-containing protein [Fictibacillus gelatini]
MQRKGLSYIIVLVALVFGFFLTFVHHSLAEDRQHYIQVTVHKGDSLWKLAENFKAKHHLSNEEFIHWVEERNGIYAGNIIPGQKITIPVKTTKD